MVRTADHVELSETEQAIVEAFGDEENVAVVDLVTRAARSHPASRVREAYWELVSEGLLVPTAAGVVRLKASA